MTVLDVMKNCVNLTRTGWFLNRSTDINLGKFCLLFLLYVSAAQCYVLWPRDVVNNNFVIVILSYANSMIENNQKYLLVKRQLFQSFKVYFHNNVIDTPL